MVTVEVVPAEQAVRTVAPEPDFIQPGELDLLPRPVPRR
jgi:hypothetical protein